MVNPGDKKCGAKTKRGKGPPCEAWAMPNGRCRLHGGKSLNGASVAQFTTGRYSKAMPEEILERYNQALADQTLLDLSAEIAVLDTRLDQLMERLVVPDVFTTLQRIRANLASLTHKDADKRTQAKERVEAILVETRDDTGAWEEIMRVIERRRRLVESERRRRIETNTTMTIEELVNTATALANVALRYIPEGPQRDGYLNDVTRIFTIQRQGNVSTDIHLNPDARDILSG